MRVCIVISMILFFFTTGFSKPKGDAETASDSKKEYTKERIEMEWNEDAWANYKQSIDTYKEGSLARTVEKLWNGRAYTTSHQCEYIYNEKGQLIKKVLQDKVKKEWIPNTQHLYAYDEKGTLIEEITQLWDGEKWVNQMKSVYK